MARKELTELELIRKTNLNQFERVRFEWIKEREQLRTLRNEQYDLEKQVAIKEDQIKILGQEREEKIDDLYPTYKNALLKKDALTKEITALEEKKANEIHVIREDSAHETSKINNQIIRLRAHFYYLKKQFDKRLTLADEYKDLYKKAFYAYRKDDLTKEEYRFINKNVKKIVLDDGFIDVRLAKTNEVIKQAVNLQHKLLIEYHQLNKLEDELAEVQLSGTEKINELLVEQKDTEENIISDYAVIIAPLAHDLQNQEAIIKNGRNENGQRDLEKEKEITTEYLNKINEQKSEIDSLRNPIKEKKRIANEYAKTHVTPIMKKLRGLGKIDIRNSDAILEEKMNLNKDEIKNRITLIKRIKKEVSVIKAIASLEKGIHARALEFRVKGKFFIKQDDLRKLMANVKELLRSQAIHPKTAFDLEHFKREIKLIKKVVYAKDEATIKLYAKELVSDLDVVYAKSIPSLEEIEEYKTNANNSFKLIYTKRKVLFEYHHDVEELTKKNRIDDNERYENYRYLHKKYADIQESDEVKPLNDVRLVIAEGKRSAKELSRRSKVFEVLTMIVLYLFIVFMAIIVLIPFYWMIITSLKSSLEIDRDRATFFPEVIVWQNYADLFARRQDGTMYFDFFVYLRNTLIVGILSTLGTLFTTIFAAFAFARLNFRGKDLLFTVLLGTMMIPGEMMVISNYVTVSAFGWVGNDLTYMNYEFGLGTFLAMIIPFWVSVFYIYLLRQNFMQIPNELYFAAKVDGKTDWKYLWKVMVPLAAPTLISISILKLMGAWNSYMWPNLVTKDTRWNIISLGLRQSFSDVDAITGLPRYGPQMAASIMVTVPLLLLFIFFRKYIMKGVGRAGIKG